MLFDLILGLLAFALLFFFFATAFLKLAIRIFKPVYWFALRAVLFIFFFIKIVFKDLISAPHS